jgi:Arc/MetJ-type ribon-helix-helix transcriptional regulator
MTINLTPEQEQRVRELIGRGCYESVDEVLEAGLAAIEQVTISSFEGTQQELEALLAEGLASKMLSEDEFWTSVNRRTDALRAEYKAGRIKKTSKDSAD